jgi:hypothetical protein
LKRAVACDFFWRQWRQLQCALIDPEKYEIVRRWGFSALPPEQIFETLFTTPGRRKKRRGGEEMAEKNQPSPKNADRREDQQPMTPKPVHAGIISERAILHMDSADAKWNLRKQT